MSKIVITRLLEWLTAGLRLINNGSALASKSCRSGSKTSTSPPYRAGFVKYSEIREGWRSHLVPFVRVLSTSSLRILVARLGWLFDPIRPHRLEDGIAGDNDCE
jgi:hypothetical protein